MRILLVVLLAVQNASAVSLYSSRPTKSVPVTGLALPSAPQLPTIPTLNADIGALAVPGALAPTAKVPVAAAAAVPAAAAQAPVAAAQPAQTAQATLQAAGEQVSAAQTAGGDVSAPLSAAFDGAQPPSAPSVAADESSFVERAIALFHPTLAKGQAPSVAAKTVPAPTTEGAVPSDDELTARMKLSPLTNPEREAAVVKLFQMGGAAAQVQDVARLQAPNLALDGVIQKQDAGRGRSNYIVVKKGKTDRIVVVGGHHDKVHEGAGTIDNWTGATMVTNLYQAMNGVETDATYVFIAFAREEEGLLGSEAFVNSLTKQQKAQIDSMVNLDTLGVDGTFSWKNNSTRSLLDLIKKVATQEKRDLIEAYLNGGDADSSTFRQAGIAAMTIFGASQDVIFDIIHTAADTMAAFSLPHYRNAYLLTLALLKALDRNPVKKPGTV